MKQIKTASIYGIIAGTNRQGSYTLKVAKYLERFIEENGQNAEVLDLSRLPLEIYQPTSYDQKPESFARWQNKVDEAKGLIICTPEYNNNIPGVLKHFLDMLKYPETLNEKMIALVGLSAGKRGAKKPIETLTKMLEYHNARIFQVTTHIPNCWNKISEDGQIIDEEVVSDLNEQMRKFVQFCEKKLNNFD